MNLKEATRKRILEIVEINKTTLSNLCLNSNITPSTLYDFMQGRTKTPNTMTIKKLCVGAGITLSEFYKPEYFNSTDDVYDAEEK